MSVLLAQQNKVIALDIDPDRVDKINSKLSTVSDNLIQDYLDQGNLSLSATLDKTVAYKEAEYVVIATPTDYDPEANFFDTSSVEAVARDVLEINKSCTIVIKSTVPVGFTDVLKKSYPLIALFSLQNFLRRSCVRG